MARVEQPRSPLVPKLSGLHLFHFEGAPCAQRVRFALAEKGLVRGAEVAWNSDVPSSLRAREGTWTSRHVSLIKKQHLTEGYAAIHPHLVVPALVHNGVLHVESMDIIDYLDATWPEHPLVPVDASAAAHARSLVDWGKDLHVSVRYVSFRWGLGRFGKLSRAEESRLKGLEHRDSPERLMHFYAAFDRDGIDAESYRYHLEALETGYATLNDLLAGDGRPFLVGSDFSIADIIWSIKVLRIHECGYPFRRNFPALFAWYQRVAARPGFQSGVMANHSTMSTAFKAKAAIANVLGRGLRQASRVYA
jgi:glutathione S-transferase